MRTRPGNAAATQARIPSVSRNRPTLALPAVFVAGQRRRLATVQNGMRALDVKDEFGFLTIHSESRRSRPPGRV